MFGKILVAIAMLLPTVGIAGSFPLLANGRPSCESLWIERNQIMNLAGYCFGSDLGQKVFDNSDCSGNQPVLRAIKTAQVERIQAAEVRLGCAIDNSRDNIMVFGRNGAIQFGDEGVRLGMWPDALRQLDVFPVNGFAEGGYTCEVNGLDPAGDGFLAVRSGPDVRYQKIGQLFNRDFVWMNADCAGDWCFANDTIRYGRSIGITGWFHTNWCRWDAE